MSNEQLAQPSFHELFERSKNDRAMIVGSEVREVIARVRELEQALKDIKKHIEIIAPQLAPLNTSWKIACTALAALHISDKAAQK